MQYIKHLSKDKLLAAVIRGHDPVILKKKKNIFLHLVASIMSQQLSVAVARVIYKRFLSLYGDQEPSAQQILETPHETLRGIGLSNAKAQYIKNIAQFHLDHGIDYRHLDKMENEAVIEYLTRIKGVGRWTVEMQLMFTLGREDVFAADDLGIQQAMINIYKLRTTDKKKLRSRLLKISSAWEPYRTYACMHLWRWKDALKKSSKT
jgi:DNA-3-methyladenine glycosylase II